VVVTDTLRAACARIAGRARSVRIREEQVRPYARSLSTPAAVAPDPPTEAAERERRAAFWITLNAINFGSGWFPTLRKPPGRTGYGTISHGVRTRFARHGPWRAAALAQITAAEVAAALGQDPAHELMELFAASLRDLGRRVEDGYEGSFAALAQSTAGSALALVQTLAEWPCFADRWHYGEIEVPFLKRAQILTADLHRGGAVRFEDLHRLTMFADNLVPHVLRLDGLLTFDPDLVRRIEAGELIEPGSPEEIEIRACALHAVELLAEASSASPARIDEILWHRGQGGAYKARPRHRCRTTAY
jgi:hypothetical protein